MIPDCVPVSSWVYDFPSYPILPNVDRFEKLMGPIPEFQSNGDQIDTTAPWPIIADWLQDTGQIPEDHWVLEYLRHPDAKIFPQGLLTKGKWEVE